MAHQVNVFACPHCNRNFKNNAGVNIHIGRMHKDKRPNVPTNPTPSVNENTPSTTEDVNKQETGVFTYTHGDIQISVNSPTRRAFKTMLEIHALLNSIDKAPSSSMFDDDVD